MSVVWDLDARARRRRMIWQAVGVPSGQLPILSFAVVERAALSGEETAGIIAIIRAARLAYDDQRGVYCPSCGHGIADVEDPYEHDVDCPDGPEGGGTDGRHHRP